MAFERSCGILLHPTSLPGRYGIGSLGEEARRFVDFLVEAGQSLWQVCPLGPTGFGDSPYQCFSAFAGNPLLVDVVTLVEWGLLDYAALESAPFFPALRVDFGPVIEWKNGVLQSAFERFEAGGGKPSLRAEFERFCAEQAAWLDDFALFMALKDAHGGAPWTTWERELIHRQTKALAGAENRLARAVQRRKFDQFLFFKQWTELKKEANDRGVRIIGDAPIFVAHDSADVWANPDLFFLDKEGNPTVVAGVPPDYFSETGQRWGNPLYRWDVLKKSGFRWWIDRIRALLTLVDIVRLDHFRGFEAYWEVPASEPTAVKGRWVKAPGEALFKALDRALGSLPILAEDLGVITPEVEALRDGFEFPGMKILQFGVADKDPANEYLPHNFASNCVVYTGTHDNDTTVGWYRGLTERERDAARRYLWCDGHNIAWDMIRMAHMSVADLCVIPLQDVLSLGSEGRMNFPGRPEGNWSWRYSPEQFNDGHAEGLLALAKTYGRVPVEESEEAEA